MKTITQINGIKYEHATITKSQMAQIKKDRKDFYPTMVKMFADAGIEPIDDTIVK